MITHPAELRELSFTIPARRELLGNPIPQELRDAKQKIIEAGYDADLEIDQPRKLLLESDDTEATLLIAIELATFTSKGVSRRPNEVGIELLKSRPRQATVDYLKALIDALPPEHRPHVEKLLQSVTVSAGIDAEKVPPNGNPLNNEVGKNDRAGFQLFRDQIVDVAITTLREDQPELAKTDLIERLETRIRLIVEDAQPTVVKRPVQWRKRLVDNLKAEFHNVFVAKNSVNEGVATLDFFVGLKTVEWKLWQAVNRDPAAETTKDALMQQDWLREHILSLPEIPIPGTQYPSHQAILSQLTAEVANPMQPMFKTALPQDQFAEVQRRLRAENNKQVPAGQIREFNDSLLFVLPHYVRHEREFRWGLRAGTDEARLPFSKEKPFVGHSNSSLTFQHLTADYRYAEQIEPFRLASNEK